MHHLSKRHLGCDGIEQKKTQKKHTLAKILLGLIAMTIGLTLVFRYLPPPFFGIMVSRQLVSYQNVKPIHHRFVPLSKISCNLIQAILAAEDQRFGKHNGFDTEAIKAAVHNNLSGRPLRGGSTISQQTAKNLFLWPSRSWLRKGLEVYFTFLIERLWSKARIMEIYLNIIEMGDNIYGAEAAAKTYFGKSAIRLTKAESALIAAILPSPLRRDPTHPSPRLRKKQRWILDQMARMRPTPLCKASTGNK